jgi:hypothetical protein
MSTRMDWTSDGVGPASRKDTHQLKVHAPLIGPEYHISVMIAWGYGLWEI